MAYFIAGGVMTPEFEQEYENELEDTLETILDGDFRSLRVTDSTQDDGGRISENSWNVGRPISPDNIPTKIKREPHSLEKLPLLDVDSFLGTGLLVCESFKDLLEELEPNVHQFWPIKILINGDVVAIRYWFVACNRIATLSQTHCYPPVHPWGSWDPSPLGERENDRLVFSTEAIGSHHAWVDKFHCDRLFSNTFGDRLKQLNLTGLKMRKLDEA
jgi:hypothetical protein